MPFIFLPSHKAQIDAIQLDPDSILHTEIQTSKVLIGDLLDLKAPKADNHFKYKLKTLTTKTPSQWNNIPVPVSETLTELIALQKH